jgi:hypothetical protein
MLPQRHLHTTAVAVTTVAVLGFTQSIFATSASTARMAHGACCSAQTCTCLLHLQGGLAHRFEKWELLALVLAAAGHDVGHKGKAFNPAVVLTGPRSSSDHQ